MERMMQKVTSPQAFSGVGVSEKVEPRGNTRLSFLAS